jgi:hypothetical protein
MSEEITKLSDSVQSLSESFGKISNDDVNDILNEISNSVEQLKRINKQLKTAQKEEQQTKEIAKKGKKFKRIRIVTKRKIRKIKRVSKAKLENFKQRLKMLASTKSFRSILLSAEKVGLVVENKALEGISNAKDTALDAKDRIKDIGLTASTYVGAGALYAKDAIKDKVELAKTGVGVAALNVQEKLVDKKNKLKKKADIFKENLVDKYFDSKYRIRTKLSNTKRHIVRKTDAEIAFFKEDVKNFFNRAKETITDKYDQMANVDDETLRRKRQEIEMLKQHRAELARRILNGNDGFEPESLGRAR